MARVQSVADLIREIREQSDEENTSAKNDDAIVRIMNRGLRFITSELARNWPDLLISVHTLQPGDYDSTTGYGPLEDAHEDRIVQVQAVPTSGSPVPIPMRSFASVSALDVRNVAVTVPQAWHQRGRRIHFVPNSMGSYPIEIQYVKRPDPLVVPIGRINTVSVESGYVICDSLEEDRISPSYDERESYVNVVNGLTGEIRCTLQVQQIVGNKVTFRSNPTRTEFDGRQVSSSLPTGDDAPDGDDYLCSAEGTCVPQLNDAFSTYVVQYAVSEIGRSLGDTMASLSDAITKRAEEAARQQRAGRGAIVRIKNRSRVWSILRTSAFPYVNT